MHAQLASLSIEIVFFSSSENHRMKLPYRFSVSDLSLVVTRLSTTSIPLLREWVQTYYGREREVIEDDILPYKVKLEIKMCWSS